VRTDDGVRCDRCKKECDVKPGEHVSHFVLIRLVLPGGGKLGYHYDLCRVCAAAAWEWLEAGAKDEEKGGR